MFPRSLLLLPLLVLAACEAPTAAPAASPRLAAPALTLASQGMVKPVAAVRDYNGTYPGTPGSGTVGYTTLYRDNYDGGAASGCNGEGCGRHPGVDIPVPSGTQVFASLGGTVVRSECNSGWGGLIVIRAASPYTGETVYFTYAHLRSRSYGVGATVSTGTVIGLSGGGSGDVCRGSSSGAHLHFQVDRNDGNDSPYFPATTALVNTGDGAFTVSQYTYNPIVFVLGGYHWSFSQAGSREFWTSVNVASDGVSDGAFWIDGNADPYVWRNATVPGSSPGCGLSRPCSAEFAAEASMYRYVKIDMYNTCWSNPLKVYFKTSSFDGWDEAKSVDYYLPGSGAVNPVIYMGGNPYWTGVVKAIRIDPAVNCASGASDPNYIGYVTLQRNSH